MQANKAYMNWSGGKDSSLALYEVLQENKFAVALLLTSVNAVHNRISMHGVRRQLLQAQAAAIGIPLTTIELPEEPGMSEYEALLQQKTAALKAQGFTKSIFGDIFLEDLRRYRENKLQALDMEAIFPLWEMDTRALVQRFIALGFKTIVVCVNEQYLDKSFCGRIIDTSFINDLPANVDDPCGENGEFHTFVFDGPIFKTPVAFSKGEMVYKEYKAPTTAADTRNPDEEEQTRYGFWFCDLY